MKNQNNSIFTIIIGFIIATGRLLLGKIEDSDDSILLVMAIINYVALGFVILFLYNDINSSCNKMIDGAGVSTVVKTNRKYIKKNISFIIYIVIFIGFLIGGIFYICKYKSNSLNDFISIIALSISIAANGLVDIISNIYYKLIKYFSEYSMRKQNSKKDSLL